MDDIRLATSEEIETFKEGSDLTPTSTLVVFPNEGKTPDVAVLRHVVEIDPVRFNPDSGLQRKQFFIFNLETALRLMGTKEYYFNVLADEENAQWRAIIEKRGAEQVSVAPELRYKKRL